MLPVQFQQFICNPERNLFQFVNIFKYFWSGNFVIVAIRKGSDEKSSRIDAFRLSEICQGLEKI
jgi:hypothetical protein